MKAQLAGRRAGDERDRLALRSDLGLVGAWLTIGPLRAVQVHRDASQFSQESRPDQRRPPDARAEQRPPERLPDAVAEHEPPLPRLEAVPVLDEDRREPGRDRDRPLTRGALRVRREGRPVTHLDDGAGMLIRPRPTSTASQHTPAASPQRRPAPPAVATMPRYRGGSTGSRLPRSWSRLMILCRVAATVPREPHPVAGVRGQ